MSEGSEAEKRNEERRGKLEEVGGGWWWWWYPGLTSPHITPKAKTQLQHCLGSRISRVLSARVVVVLGLTSYGNAGWLAGGWIGLVWFRCVFVCE